MKIFALAFLLVPVLAGCDSTDDTPAAVTITAAVVADPQLSTLEAAVIRAGLDDDLAGTGPFTVFAPTDAAFSAALTALGVTQEQLFSNTALLSSILTAHVVSGERLAASLTAGTRLTTLNGEVLTVVAVGTGLGLDTEDADTAANATITTTNIDASNGVVHKIGAVLLPTAN